MRPIVPVLFIAFALLGCGRSGLRGVVQSSTWTADGWALALGTASAADYVLVERQVLLDVQGVLAVQNDSRNLLFLGNQFIGKRIKVTGDVQRDDSGRRFVRITKRDQIEYF